MIDFNSFDSWTLVVIPRRRNLPNKGIDLGDSLYDYNLTVFSRAKGMGEEQDLTEACLPCFYQIESLQLGASLCFKEVLRVIEVNAILSPSFQSLCNFHSDILTLKGIFSSPG